MGTGVQRAESTSGLSGQLTSPEAAHCCSGRNPAAGCPRTEETSGVQLVAQSNTPSCLLLCRAPSLPRRVHTPQSKETAPRSSPLEAVSPIGEQPLTHVEHAARFVCAARTSAAACCRAVPVLACTAHVMKCILGWILIPVSLALLLQLREQPSVSGHGPPHRPNERASHEELLQERIHWMPGPGPRQVPCRLLGTCRSQNGDQGWGGSVLLQFLSSQAWVWWNVMRRAAEDRISRAFVGLRSGG